MSGKFLENEKILAFHGPLIYEAKILKVSETKDAKTAGSGTPRYFIHYHGWNKNWDEWVKTIDRANCQCPCFRNVIDPLP